MASTRNRTSRGSAATSSRRSVPRLRPSSWRATKNRVTEFRPTARGTPGGPWPPGDLRDGQEPTAISAKGAGQGGDADVVCHVRRLLKSRSARAPNWVRGQDTIAGPPSSSPDKPGQVESCNGAGWRFVAGPRPAQFTFFVHGHCTLSRALKAVGSGVEARQAVDSCVASRAGAAQQPPNRAGRRLETRCCAHSDLARGIVGRKRQGEGGYGSLIDNRLGPYSARPPGASALHLSSDLGALAA